MSGETAVAVSSTAPEVATIELPKSGSPEYAEWRVTGEVPEPKADSTPAPTVDAGEATTPPKKQERRRPDAEARIKELAAKVKQLEAERAQPTKPAETQPKVESQPQQYTRPKPTVDDRGADGKPKYATYEDFVEELGDWKAEQRWAAQERERQQRQQSEEVAAKVKEAETRYPNFKEIAVPTVDAIVKNAKIAPVIKQMLNDSEVWTDLIFTIGSEPSELAAFVEMAEQNPGKALRYIALTENLITEELDKGATRTTPEKGPDGKFIKAETAAPAKRGPESAPEPPLEVGNRGSGPMDESARALSDIERGNTSAVRNWLRAENAKELRRRKGA